MKFSRILSIFVCLSASLFVSAQETISSGFDLENFPKVSYTWHDNNPEQRDSSEFFDFRENGVATEFTLEIKSREESKEQVGHLLVLWEDLAHYGKNMLNFSRSSLKHFLIDNELSATNRIAIYSFSRKTTSEGSYLKPVSDGFSSDNIELLGDIQEYTPNTRRYSTFPNRSDIFPSIIEAIDLLKGFGEGPKAIVLITAGYPLDNSASSSDVTAKLEAEKYHVPVYVMQYARDHGQSPKLQDFASLTFGSFVSYSDINQNVNISDASAHLSKVYNTYSERYCGNDYVLSFESSVKRGGKASLIEFSIDGQKHEVQFFTPANTLLSFIKENLVLFILILLLVLAAIGYAVYYFIKRKRLSDQRFDVLQQQNQNVHASAMSAISESNRQINKRFDDARQKVVEQRLQESMNNKSQYPRLVISINNTLKKYTISKPCVTIGRDDDNDVVLNSFSVSRKHAQIVYSGNEYVLIDDNSRNGVSVNGEKIVEPRHIKDGDKILLGDVSITFYL